MEETALVEELATAVRQGEAEEGLGQLEDQLVLVEELVQLLLALPPLPAPAALGATVASAATRPQAAGAAPRLRRIRMCIHK